MTKKLVRVSAVLLLATSLSGCLPLLIANGVIQVGGLAATGINKLKQMENEKERKQTNHRSNETAPETPKED